MYIIAADVGGTKTRLAFADAAQPDNILYEKRYLSGDFDGFSNLLQAFIDESNSAEVLASSSRVDTLALALPGLVNESSARLTNLPWVIEKQSLKDQFGIEHIQFMNDFQASAFGIARLHEEDTIVLNPGDCLPEDKRKNSIRIAVGAGTGLGVAWADVELSANGQTKDICAHDTEGGHIDFAPQDDVQFDLLKFLQKRHQHVSYERILSGDGLVALYQFCNLRQSVGNVSNPDLQQLTAEWVNQNADRDNVADCAVNMFVQIYGAYIGNIAMLFKPYDGIYITGGIAAKILNRMQSDTFIDAYLNKGRMRQLVEKIPVYVVTNERVGMLGAMSEAITEVIRHNS